MTDRRMVRVFSVVLLCSAGILATAGASESIRFDDRPGTVSIDCDGVALATYVYEDETIARPYFKDLCAPGGAQVTRHHPPREGIDRTDHADMHPGLWLAFGDVSGADFWRNKARVEHVRFVKRPWARKTRAGFTVHNRYRAGDKVICEETCEYTFLVRPAGYLILWDSVFQSDESAFYFGDQEEMGLGVRLATPIMVKSKQGGRILDNEGRKNEKGIWGKPALWCDYSGWLGTSFAGVMIMPAPNNVRPCRWHTRNYGFMAANPFGREVFGAGSPSKLSVNVSEPFHLRFGVLIHAGASEASVDFDAAYQDYIKLLKSRLGSESTDK